MAGQPVGSLDAAASVYDVTTGEFLAWDTPEGDGAWDALAARLQEFAPREVVHPEGFAPKAEIAGRPKSVAFERNRLPHCPA